MSQGEVVSFNTFTVFDAPQTVIDKALAEGMDYKVLSTMTDLSPQDKISSMKKQHRDPFEGHVDNKDLPETLKGYFAEYLEATSKLAKDPYSVYIRNHPDFTSLTHFDVIQLQQADWTFIKFIDFVFWTDPSGEKNLLYILVDGGEAPKKAKEVFEKKYGSFKQEKIPNPQMRTMKVDVHILQNDKQLVFFGERPSAGFTILNLDTLKKWQVEFNKMAQKHYKQMEEMSKGIEDKI